MHRLRAYRQKNELTQQALAEKLETSKSYVSDIENGVRPGFDMMLKIAEVTGIPVTYWKRFEPRARKCA